MKVYAYKHTIGENGVLSLGNLPLNTGEKIEVLIIPLSPLKSGKKRYPFWGKPITYPNPTDPVAEEDWEI